MPPPQSFVAPPTPLLRVKWAAGWPISRSPSVSQTKTSGYSQTPEEKQKISLSERRREREEGRGLGINYAGVRTERNRETTSSFSIQPAEYTYPIPGQHLSSILVDDVDVSRGLHPSLSIHLSWHCLIPHYGDFHTTTLQTKMGFILSNISKGTDTYMYHKISCIQTTIKYKKPSSHVFHTLKCYLTFN